MTSFFSPPKDGNQNKITAAEVTSVYHNVQHGLSYRSGDCTTKLAPVIFPDSEIAKKLACGRTKSASIVTGVLAPASLETCLKQLNTPMIADRPDSLPHFSIASDASNHGTTKLFPLALRYYTPDLGVQNKLLDFYDDCNENSDAIFNQVVSRLERNLGLERISAYSADNASVNYGVHNSVYKKLTDKNASVIKANCVAHILHNCGRYAGDKLRIDIENIVTKVCNHFSSSAKRVQELKEVFEFVDEEYTALYKNVPTRWLSLWPAVKRLHDSWPAVKSYFLSLGEERCPSALWKLLANCEDGEDVPCELQAYLLFLQNSLKVFFDAVLKVEGDETTVCELFELMTNLKLKLEQRKND
uniref:Uncharacterized protein n=1 Tax=Cyprinus carpio carpio TaxID=630221 RepID=A0A9J8D4G3_CYPCA